MRFKKIRIIGIILLFIALVISGCSGSKNERTEKVFAIDDYEGKLAAYFFHLEGDEKTGESIFIKTPKGQTILIDAGIPDSGPTVDKYLDKLDIDKIDYVMPSHPHIDHIGGLHTIFKTKDIGKVIEINIPHDTKTYETYKDIMEEENIDVEIGEAGDVIELEDDLTLEIINPPKGTDADSLPENYSDLAARYINDVSMVIKMTYKEKSFLFTGDIYFVKETELVQEYDDELESDVLVAPHHGHETSSSRRFIHAVNPDITMIPSNQLFSQKVYYDYAEISDVYHSYYHGNVVLVSDGENIDVYTEKDKEDEE